MIARPHGQSSPGREATRRELRDQYSAYRRRQALQLVHMMPREAIRPLVRAARASEPEPGPDDPLEMLVGYCERILPLPPFEVWAADLSAHPDAHLRDLDASPEAPTAEAPSTAEVRALEYGGSTWEASLKLFRDGWGWRGFITFEEGTSGRAHRTAMIFREDDPAELRTRFLNFENASLEAFLRSALP